MNLLLKSELTVVISLTGEIISAYLYYMIIFSFQGQFMVLQLVK